MITADVAWSVSRLARLSVALSPTLFTIVWLTGPLWHPAYDPFRDSVSRLAVGPNGWVQSASFVVFGILLMAMTVFLFTTLPRRRLSIVGAAFLALFAAGVLGAGLFDLATQSALHQVFSAVAFVSVVAAMLILWRDFAGSEMWRPLGTFTLIAGIISAGLLLFFLIGVGSDVAGLGQWSGSFQRLFILSWTVWLQVVALRLN
jgi:hypothetical protein